MSYILDALKKSEQERRQHRTAPNLETIHQASDIQPQSSSVPLLVGLALVLIALVLGYVGYQQWAAEPPPASAPPAPSPVTMMPVETRAADAAASALYQRSASAESDTQVSSLYSDTKPTPQETPVPSRTAEGGLPAIHQLPLALQSRIGPMDYSAHVYSSDASRGFAIINGKRRYREDRLENGLTVVTVLEEAVVMEFMGQLFILEAMQSWPVTKNK